MSHTYLTGIMLFVAPFLHAQSPYQHDRVYTGNQVSNTVSVIDPATQRHLGDIPLGKPQPFVLSPLYKGQSLVHGLRFDPQRGMLAVVSIGSNSLTFIRTATNEIVKTIYLGRAPHEPTFTPDGREVWITVRGEAYLSVVDVEKMEETKRIPVSDGPGMIAFSKDGKRAFVASSFSPILDVVDAATYQVIKRIPVVSPFSPNIYTSADGQYVAMTHKDVGKVSLIDPQKLEVIRTLDTGALTNHVTFSEAKGRLLLSVTVGGENSLKIYDVANECKLLATIPVGALPHGLWPSPDGKLMYVGLEYLDAVQPVDMETMQALPAISIGQSPQALLYAPGAVKEGNGVANLTKSDAGASTLVVEFQPVTSGDAAKGRIAARTIGAIELIEHSFSGLKPETTYALLLSKASQPEATAQELSAFVTDAKGKYAGHSTGSANVTGKHLFVVEKNGKQIVLLAKP